MICLQDRYINILFIVNIIYNSNLQTPHKRNNKNMLKNKNTNKSEITYKNSGVNIDEGNKLITDLAQITETTSNRGSIGELEDLEGCLI